MGNRRSLTLLCTALLVSSNALGTEPANLQAGPWYITPTLEVETRYSDNYLRAESDTTSTWILDTAPEVQMWLQNGESTYSGTLALRDYRYSETSKDDFTDYKGNIDIHHEFDAKNILEAFAEYYDGHEERGTGLSEGDVAQEIDEPVEVDMVDYGVGYTLGNKRGPARLNFGFRFHEREYKNFREETQFRDYQQDFWAVRGFYSVGPKTDLVAEVRYADTEYETDRSFEPGGTLNNQEYNYLVGVEWEATAKTSGSIKLGWFDREYDSSERKEDDGFSWEVDAYYKPRSYSVFNLETKRFSQETNGLGDSIDTEQLALRWTHDWSFRGTTRLEVVQANERYSGSFRDDDLWFVEARYTRKMRRWFDLSGGYRYEERDSGENTFSYDQNVYFLRLDLSL